MYSAKYATTHLFSLFHPEETYAGFNIQNPVIKPADRTQARDT